ncbi:metallophosphoesterase [Aminithiophilus ramosus]|uniref:Metallophosphoesterase n=2 Tax=Synergistales TaxID=649776 RepID=A0A9Q7EYN1_9BACT|nr:metallophosphoesterase [Aminithiophilus ramosus]QTX31422.1 metallophosphoesterase [Aminithiophilus ramosus]QVL35224.1 metallophosphoesterase [Synergistota bacterium]
MSFIKRLFGIPPERPPWEGLVVHLADTPSCSYRYLRRLLRRLRPDWIVHTGDLVDDVKLGLYPQLEKLYAERLSRLLDILEEGPSQVILVMGNHDAASRVRARARSSQILTEPANLTLGRLSLRVAHGPEGIMTDPQPMNLFGHDLTLRSGMREEKLFLNGIEGIHLICPTTGLFRRLRYPIGTDDSRLLRRRCRP